MTEALRKILIAGAAVAVMGAAACSKPAEETAVVNNTVTETTTVTEVPADANAMAPMDSNMMTTENTTSTNMMTNTTP